MQLNLIEEDFLAGLRVSDDCRAKLARSQIVIPFHSKSMLRARDSNFRPPLVSGVEETSAS